MIKLTLIQKNQSILDTVKNYGKKLFNYIRSHVKSDEDAEDILQEVWYQLISTVEKEPIEHLSAWLYKVSRNKIIDRNRKKKSISFNDHFKENGEEETYEDLIMNDVDIMQEIENQFFIECVLEILKELPEKQRQVFVWNELEGITLQEIADMTGENIKTIISRKNYAVNYLRKRFKNRKNEF
ncbi:MAG TPA: sigma-70 family RNA polymerase sigma factor [Ignavibacteria bacterium]